MGSFSGSVWQDWNAFSCEPCILSAVSALFLLKMSMATRIHAATRRTNKDIVPIGVNPLLEAVGTDVRERPVGRGEGGMLDKIVKNEDG